MTPIRSLLALALLAVSAQAPAAISCAAGTSTLYHLNFPPSAPDLEPALGLPGGAGQAAEVLTVITRAGVASEERVKEVNLDLEDLSFSKADYNASVRDYRDGVLMMDVCVPADAASILSHVTYRDGSGSLRGFYSAAATPREGPSGPYMAAVADRAGTARLGRSFNEGGAEVMRDWIEADTGVRPPRSTAEALFSAAQAYVLGVAARSDALAHPVDAGRGAREGASLLVTGSSSDWWMSSAYSDVTTIDGRSLLGPTGRLQNLEDRLGQTLVGHKPSGAQPIHVVDARAELDASAGECNGDSARIQASLTNPSPLAGTIVLRDGAGRELTRGEAIDEAVACGATFTVEAFRTTPQGHDLDKTSTTQTIDAEVSEPTGALAYVNKWLPHDDSKFYLSNQEVRAMINGNQGTKSYARDMAQIIVDHTPNIPFDIEFWEQTLRDYADGNTNNDELERDFDPVQWNSGAGFRLYDDHSNSVTDFNMDSQGMQEMYSLIKGIDSQGNPNNGFLTTYVSANPRLYGGEPGGEPDMDFNPTWASQDPN